MGVWTGATSVKKLKLLLRYMSDAGINTSMFFIYIGELPSCRTRKKFPGSTKPIVIKPVSHLQTILPRTLTRVLLVDDDIEKMQ